MNDTQNDRATDLEDADLNDAAGGIKYDAIKKGERITADPAPTGVNVILADGSVRVVD